MRAIPGVDDDEELGITVGELDEQVRAALALEQNRAFELLGGIGRNNLGVVVVSEGRGIGVERASDADGEQGEARIRAVRLRHFGNPIVKTEPSATIARG